MSRAVQGERATIAQGSTQGIALDEEFDVVGKNQRAIERLKSADVGAQNGSELTLQTRL